MSQFIETADDVYVAGAPQSGGGRPDHVFPTRSASRSAFPLRTEVRSFQDRRLSNLRGNVSRCEADLSAARTSPALGGRSTGLIRQLARRLHQANAELADARQSVLAEKSNHASGTKANDNYQRS